MMERLAQPSGSSSVMYAIVNSWAAVGFLLLGYSATQGRKWAFAVGIAAYAIDGTLLIANGEYVSVAFHVVILYLIYRGFAALAKHQAHRQSDAASAAHGG